MNRRTFTRAAATGLLGLTLAGGGVALAQTSTVTPPASPPASVPANASPMPRGGMGQPGGQGGQGGQKGMGQEQGQGPDHGGGPRGAGDGMGPQTPTTASVTSAINDFATRLKSVTADRDYANGKMDLATVNSLIDRATALHDAAQTALTANNLTQASGDIRAAEGALRGADDLIVASIGSTGLPSAANRPAPPTNDNGNGMTTPTADQMKARSSNELARTYQNIVDTANRVKANSGVTGDPSFYVTTAQGLYKQAYDLFNSGKYDSASQTARAADGIAHVADALLQGAGVASSGPQAVPVPAPNF